LRMRRVTAVVLDRLGPAELIFFRLHALLMCA